MKNILIGSLTKSFIFATNNNYAKILTLARVEIPHIEDPR